MTAPSERPQTQDPPDWAVQEASDEIGAVRDPLTIRERARQLAREREDERHDEFDDPDQGGEA